MNKFKIRLSQIVLGALLPLTPCFGDLSFKLNNFIAFSKENFTIEHLDHGNFLGTAETTNWRSSNEFITYRIKPKLIWQGDIGESKIYILGAGVYGWLLDGKEKSPPLTWDVDGHEWGFDTEMGFIFNACNRFKLIPYFGFEYNQYHTKIKHQHLLYSNPDSYVSQDGNKTDTLLYFPYVGIEFDFNTRICCQDLQCFASYQIGYGGGHGRNRVPHTIITDNPNTSRYGSKITFRKMLAHEFEIAAFYRVAKKWQMGIELDYSITYNTKKLPLKLQHNDEIVERGQFTRTQFHRISNYNSQTFSVIFSIIYNITGEGGVVVK